MKDSRCSKQRSLGFDRSNLVKTWSKLAPSLGSFRQGFGLRVRLAFVAFSDGVFNLALAEANGTKKNETERFSFVLIFVDFGG